MKALVWIYLILGLGAELCFCQGPFQDTATASIGNSVAELRKYDLVLDSALESVREESVSKSISWGKLGLMYYERDIIWKQGGIGEALPCFAKARELASSRLEQHERELQLLKKGTLSSVDELSKEELDWLNEGKEEGQIGRELTKQEREKKISEAFHIGKKMNSEIFAWTLQEEILYTALGEGDKALQMYDDALTLVGDNLYRSEYAKQLKASVYHHIGDTYLRLFSDPDKALEYIENALNMDPCAPEAGDGRLKWVHAKNLQLINREKDKKRKEIPSITIGLNFSSIALREWESLALGFEVDLMGVESERIPSLKQRCEKEWTDDENGSLRVNSNASSEPKLELNKNRVDSEFSFDGVPEGDDDDDDEEDKSESDSERIDDIVDVIARSRPKSSPITMLHWTLHHVYDYMQKFSSKGGTLEPLKAVDGSIIEQKKLTEQFRAASWKHLEDAHTQELETRYPFVKSTMQSQALADGSFVHRLGQGGDTGYSANNSAISAAKVVKTFIPGYWPPQDAHEKKVGYNPVNPIAVSTTQTQMTEDVDVKGHNGHTSLQLQLQRQYGQPIFIVGFFRTGSTLLEQMLSNHPDVATIGEDSVFNVEMRALEDDLILISKGKQNKKHNTENEKVENVRARDNIEAIKYRSISILDKMYSRVTGRMARTGNQLNLNIDELKMSDMSNQNNENNESLDPSIRIIDKMLINYRNLGLIHLLYPHATIIHMVRDPMDTLYSCYKNRFADDSSVYTLEMQSLVHEYKLYLEVMQHFRNVLPPLSPNARKAATARTYREGPSFTNRIVDIQYRDLVVEPEITMKALLRRLGLKWDSNVLKTRTNENETRRKQPRTLSYLQVKQPLYTSSLGQWTKYALELRPLASNLALVLPDLWRNRKALPFFERELNEKSSDNKKKNADMLRMKKRNPMGFNRTSVNWKLDPNFPYALTTISTQDN